MNTNAQPPLNHIYRYSHGNHPSTARKIPPRATDSYVPPITDEALIAQADELFLTLDEAEAADAEKA
ncbi:MAG: hypothetical protein BECKG1743F_GA0114225_100644 [Candidatus Kentron sp. G]|nr:MAG: hypothetical protein BECKG1743F_GA0114225_100644 [Candidatus Kentron sp. G]